MIFGKWAIIFAVVGVVSSGFIALVYNNIQYIFFSFPFIISATICHAYLKKANASKEVFTHKLTELKREINQLGEEFDRNKELHGAFQKKLDRYSALKELTELLSSSLNLKELVHFITEEAFKIIGKSERMLLFLVDERKQELALAGSKKLDADSQIMSKKGDTFDRWVLDKRRPLMISDVGKDDRFLAHKRRYKRHLESLISVPMMLEDRILGILRLEALYRNSYTADDLRILYVIADISAVAINNTYLYARTEELAIKDGLTDLYVHRYFKERLRDELKRAERKEHKFSLLMIDIDHFKHYNDKYGHAAGDVVLQHIARSLYKFADTGDVIARYGGEEFAVILAEEDKREAVKIAEEIRKHVANDLVHLRDHKGNVTVSIGVATYPRDGFNEEGLIRVADTHLYRAKKEGRNRVCS